MHKLLLLLLILLLRLLPVLLCNLFSITSLPLVKYRIHSKQLSHENISNSLDYIEKLKSHLLDSLSIEEKTKYVEGLKTFRKKKPLSKKTMEFGLKFLINSIPEKAADKLLVFYLNKIRRTRN